MILLEHIWKSYGRGRKKKDVLRDLNVALDCIPGSIGILGGKHSGKTTLINIMAGITCPDSGRVRRRMRVSWPLNWRGFAGITGDAQVAFLSRIYQINRSEALRFVAELSELGRKLYEPTSSYSPREKDRLMVATALALDFDTYLIDEAIPAIEPAFASGYAEVWKNIAGRSMQIVFTSHPEKVVKTCSVAAILHEGQLTAPMPVDEATRAFAASQQRMSQSRRKANAQRA